MSRRLPCFVLLACASTISAPVHAQAVPTRALARPDATIDEPFTFVGGIRELRDGRVITFDRRDKILQLANFRGGTVAQIGREGSGPGEYGLPTVLLPLPADSSLVFDALNSRFLVLLPDGKPGHTFRLEEPASPSGGGGAVISVGGPALGTPRAIDGAGRLYFEGRPFKLGADGAPTTADSVPIIRHDRRTKRTDTLAWLQMPKDEASVTSSGSANNRSVSMRVGSTIPFGSRDSWSVFPDGRVAIVRLSNYHVDIIGPDRSRVSGPAVPFTPVRVGNAEKQQFREQSERTPGIAMSISDNNGSRQTSVNTSPRKFEEPATWPTVKPAFLSGGIYARTNGEVWVQRHVSAADLPTFDVFNSTGRHVQRVTLPKGHRLVGFGDGNVYTVRLDEDDLQYLNRFKG